MYRTMNNLTAIVTGASEGLGKSLALELAEREIHLILVALPDSGLNELSEYIKKNYSVAVYHFEFDLTNADSCQSLFSNLKDLNIKADILINNAGLGNLNSFADRDIAFYKMQIELNVIAPVLLTRLFLDQINKKQECYLLNVGSLGGQFLVPKKQVYGATKSFISYFTKCLQVELAGTPVKISLLCPGGINTKPELLVLNSRLKGIAQYTILEPEQVAGKAIDGLLKGKKEIVPGILNQLLLKLDFFLPEFFKNRIIRNSIIKKQSAVVIN